MIRLFWIVLIFSKYSLSECPYQTLPQPFVYADGKFYYPNGTPQCFSQGSQMNVSWLTTYSTSSLCLIKGDLWLTTYSTSSLCLIKGDLWNDPVGVVLNTAIDWHVWTVDSDTSSHSIPFVFRVVNAQGSAEAQQGGGFLSGQFFINFNTDSCTSTSIYTTTTMPTSSTSSTIGIPNPAILPTTQGISSWAPVSSSPGNLWEENSSHNLGLGLGIGLGVPFCIAVCAALSFWSRRCRQQPVSIPQINDSTVPAPTPTPMYEALGHDTNELDGNSTWDNGATTHQSC